MSESFTSKGPSAESQLQDQPKDGTVYLVVGDWFVDEHWVCGVHRSSSSSRTGKTHLRALHSPNSTLRAFCGAGRSAQFLHQLYQKSGAEEPVASLIGLGFWHRADTEALTSFFDLETPPQTPYSLTSTFPTRIPPKGIELINMNEALNLKGDIESRDAKEYTTRVIRIYTHGRHDQVQYDRLDWERRAPAAVKWQGQNLEALSNLLYERIGGRKIGAVIIKDMKKGVINHDIIRWLLSLKTRDVPWFVSTKEWCPSWLKEIGNEANLQLVMIPQVAARTAVLDNDKELSCWLTRSGRPSKEAIDLIDDFAECTKAKNIFVLPDGLSAFACKCTDQGVSDVVIQSHIRPEKISVEMGYASIVFPALVACMLHSSTNAVDRDVSIDRDVMKLSLRAAYEWVEFEAQRVFQPENWSPKPPWSENETLRCMRKLVQDHETGAFPKFGAVSPSSWADEREEWKQALTEVGIVNHLSKRRLELWRAMVEVDGYVCCEESGRKELRHLLQGVQAFAQHPRHHASCMLIASPGSGKTFLAKRLAQTADLRFVPFNITQMRSKADILECLDTIVATQAEEDDRPLMVFIDEINAKLENTAVYGAFLTPLEDGTYVRSGRTFKIRPCMWVFAGTRDPKGDTTPATESYRRFEEEKPEKGSDFTSRLTLGVLNLMGGGLEQVHHQAISDDQIRATERVYLGACMLRTEFPDVRRVSERVLRAFHQLPRGTTVREIKHFVRRFHDIQYGEVTERSLPNSWPGYKHGEVLNIQKHWDKENYSDRPNITIVTAAESDQLRE